MDTTEQLTEAILDEVSQVCGLPDQGILDDLREDVRLLVQAGIAPLLTENHRLREQFNALLAKHQKNDEA